jgi:hypothetical protein
MLAMPSFQDLWAAWPWTPIAGCPGRFRLAQFPRKSTPTDRKNRGRADDLRPGADSTQSRSAITVGDLCLPIAVLLGCEAPVTSHDIPSARDRVLVARLRDGGVISYLRANGTCLHTLNTADGFDRKLRQLGIAPEAV